MEVGFVGLGNMGIPMASRLLAAGFSVVGSDANPEACARAEQKGMKIVASPKDLADSVETIFLSLPTPAIVKAVCLGDNGIIFGGKVRRVVDMSTTGSATAIEVGQALKANGIQLIDCPVSGGVSGAVNGTLAVMVSCPVADYEFLQPALKQIGKLFFIGEEPGLAHVMKLVNNYLSATALAATSEAMAIATKAGIDPAVAIDVINAGSGRNSASQDKFPRSVLPGTFSFGFTSGLMFKDLQLCEQEAERLDLDLSVQKAVIGLWKQTLESQGQGSDFTVIAKHVEDQAGVKIRSSPK